MTDRRAIEVLFGGMSTGLQLTTSTQMAAAWNGYSIKNGFTPSRNIDSGACTLAQLVTIVQTIIHDLTVPK